MDFNTLQARIASCMGISTLMPMQEAMGKVALPCRAMLLAPTGSGKTLAFSIAFLRSLKADTEGVCGVVLVPTRELALQVYDMVRTLATPEFKVAAFYGGHRMETEVNSLAGKPDIIVATPGRLLDHLQRGNLSGHDVKSLVLDEYDKSLELGFAAEMSAIVGRMKGLKTLILTSATALAELPTFLGKEAVSVFDYSNGDELKPDILFRLVESPSADKIETLEALLRDFTDEKTIVFVNHRDAAERVWGHLHKHGFCAGLYHGGLEQEQRERAMVLFANGTKKILVSTDLASRGLDIDGVGVVVHYHLPVSEEALTHRNGRTGRMGASGLAFAIVSDNDKIPDYFPTLERYWPEGSSEPKHQGTSTLYFNAGRKEKISKGDIAGFLMKKGGLGRDEVGRIDVKDHCAYVAVPSDKATNTIKALSPHKIKNVRVKVSLIKL